MIFFLFLVAEFVFLVLLFGGLLLECGLGLNQFHPLLLRLFLQVLQLLLHTVNLGLDEVDTLVDVSDGLGFILLGEDGTDEFVDVGVVLQEFELVLDQLVFLQLRVQSLPCLYCLCVICFLSYGDWVGWKRVERGREC